jgi:Holliday junction resolvasome RuvABC endonuclease subunit
MSNNLQAIKFVLVDFDDNWDRTMLVTGYANIRYTALKEGARLAVVFEGATGVMTSYSFQLAAKEEVFVVDQVVHVPSRCQGQEAGNTVECRASG